jgi:hypothetical protein
MERWVRTASLVVGALAGVALAYLYARQLAATAAEIDELERIPVLAEEPGR